MTERSLRPLTEEEYLALEEANPVRHELVGGIPYAGNTLHLPCPEGILGLWEIYEGVA